METTQNPPSEFDYAAAAADIVRYVRQQWPDAGTWYQAQALIVAVYAVGGSVNGAAVLAASIPTLSSKCR